MGSSRLFDRRHALGVIAAAPVLMAGRRVTAEAVKLAIPPMVVFRDPSCGCCHLWVEHLVRNGFSVTVRDAASMPAVKVRLGVPRELASCHTAEIGGYVIEGHVPAVAIQRLLSERPDGRGLAVPGMPVGSPGMEGGEPETYDVILFGDGLKTSFGRYREDKAV